LAREIEELAVDAVVTIDRKSRRSIRRVEDLEEGLETKTMAAPGATPDLDAQLEDQDLEKAIKTSVATPAQLDVPKPPAKEEPGATGAPRPSAGPRPEPPAAGPRPPA
jgi:hypothetical protein